MKKILYVFVTMIFLLSLASCGVEIADTNGPDNISLAEITDENILKMDIGASGYSEITKDESGTKEYKGNGFSGVAEVYITNFVGKSDLTVDLSNYNVDAGNCKLVAILNEEIVHEFKPGELTETFELTDVKGTFSIRLAGESADFEFYMQVR